MPARLPCCALQIGRVSPRLATYRIKIVDLEQAGLIRHLERCGYAECRPDPNDKRARRVRLTAMGRQLEAAIRKHARAAEKELEHQLGPARFRELLTTLRKMNGLSEPP